MAKLNPFAWIASIISAIIMFITTCAGFEGGLMTSFQIRLMLIAYNTTVSASEAEQVRDIICQRLEIADYERYDCALTIDSTVATIDLSFNMIGKEKARALEILCRQGEFHLETTDGEYIVGKDAFRSVTDADIEKIVKPVWVGFDNFEKGKAGFKESFYALEFEINEESTLWTEMKYYGQIFNAVLDGDTIGTFTLNGNEFGFGGYYYEAVAEAYEAVIMTPALPYDFQFTFPEI